MSKVSYSRVVQFSTTQELSNDTHGHLVIFFKVSPTAISKHSKNEPDKLIRQPLKRSKTLCNKVFKLPSRSKLEEIKGVLIERSNEPVLRLLNVVWICTTLRYWQKLSDKYHAISETTQLSTPLNIVQGVL